MSKEKNEVRITPPKFATLRRKNRTTFFFTSPNLTNEPRWFVKLAKINA
jgi:hypothetical protein